MTSEGEFERVVGEVAKDADKVLPYWLRPDSPESRFPVAIAIVVAVVLQYRLQVDYGLKPRWLIPSLELVLLAVLVVVNPVRLNRSTRLARVGGIALVAAITFDNTLAAVNLEYAIVTGRVGDDAAALLTSGASIYLTNIIAFGIWFWELDRGGPFARGEGRKPSPDFLFPQMTAPDVAPKDWTPNFVDYLYVSFTNVTAFSPTDTMPMSRWAKALMAVQSAVALSIAALVIARAVNILK